MTPASLPPTTERTNHVDEAARRRFEAAWRAGQPRPIEEFLPAPDQSSYLPTLEELVHIELEFAWKAALSNGSGDTVEYRERPLVEGYLARFPRLA